MNLRILNFNLDGSDHVGEDAGPDAVGVEVVDEPSSVIGGAAADGEPGGDRVLEDEIDIVELVEGLFPLGTVGLAVGV